MCVNLARWNVGLASEARSSFRFPLDNQKPTVTQNYQLPHSK